MPMTASKVTLKDVAARAGVSYQTVSKVLNGDMQVAPETMERIQAAVQELGYRPNRIARNMRAGRSFMIGYSWTQTEPGQVNHILDQFLSSMVREASAVGYYVLPFPFSEGKSQIDSYRDLIRSGNVDGFVLSSVNYHDPRIQYLLKQKFPFVAFGRSNPEWDFAWVDIDGAAGTRQAIEYLIGRGHRRIAILAWPEESRVGNDRLQGYLDAMRAAEIDIEPGYLLRGEGTFEVGRAMTLHLLELPPERRPTAIMALNDTMAIGAMAAARECGLEIGTDLAIIGFDDAPMVQYLFPPLTSVRQPIAEAGHKCVELLVSLVEGRPIEQHHILLSPSLIIRASA
ncbi:MAG TPA: LacI family transcriptional regulator [Chloroflexus aurantiacus]|uniref:Alanine racemase n=2 Tax=Chloroflexaceae TaxID=1106 RepID=A9WEH6_CHLAA|nr:Alanine racemase [Chloroflexus aurantiacus J-10-fl]RMG50344.1 MAG: LacI family transcriptional regulator [Chloroflexota bacterium]GIV92359.1 MAG: alanine racemase [Chloroflexus sp.]HBW65874.1 LacI family transcriptional regulator [Chloroflexus aurantiacus]